MQGHWCQGVAAPREQGSAVLALPSSQSSVSVSCHSSVPGQDPRALVDVRGCQRPSPDHQRPQVAGCSPRSRRRHDWRVLHHGVHPPLVQEGSLSTLLKLPRGPEAEGQPGQGATRHPSIAEVSRPWEPSPAGASLCSLVTSRLTGLRSDGAVSPELGGPEASPRQAPGVPRPPPPAPASPPS